MTPELDKAFDEEYAKYKRNEVLAVHVAALAACPAASTPPAPSQPLFEPPLPPPDACSRLPSDLPCEPLQDAGAGGDRETDGGLRDAEVSSASVNLAEAPAPDAVLPVSF